MVGNTAGGEKKNEILVPLTSSLYVKGELADREKVLVDVGTGFFVEKVRRSRVICNGILERFAAHSADGFSCANVDCAESHQVLQ